MELRPYQEQAKQAIHREWSEGKQRTLLVLPTGCGKTIVFAKLIEDLVRRGERVLILAHRGELLDQAADKIAAATGLGCGVEKAELSCKDELFRVVVGSVQTLMREKRLLSFPRDYFHTLIVDEAHHCLADSYRRVIDHFGGSKLLGVTATPDRGDMRELGEVFNSLAFEYSLPRAIRDGYLVPIKALTIPLQLDISGVGQSAGDYQASALGAALDPYLEQIADVMLEHCRDCKSVVFLPLIATSQRFCELLKAKGMRAVEVNGESRDRAEILKRFDAWDSGVLCNAMLLTEGWDCPSVDCIVPLRATRIRSLFAQMVGRGTRLHSGKDHLLLLDFLWTTSRLALCRPASLVSTNAEVEAQATEAINAAGGPVDLIEAEEQAEGDCVAERERALAEKLHAMRRRKQKLVDPIQFEMSIGAEDLSAYVPSFGWETDPVSVEQAMALEKSGLLPDSVENAGKAKLVLDTLQKRRDSGLTTAKQIRFLEQKGFEHVGKWEFDAARRLIDRIAGNGWRTPRGINPATYTPDRKAKVCSQ